MEKNNRTKMIDVQDQTTGAWTTRASFAARHGTTAERRTILERLEEREQRRASKLADQAYDRYHVLVFLAKLLDAPSTLIERPSDSEDLEGYIARCDDLIETLAGEFALRQEEVIRDRILVEIDSLRSNVEEYVREGVVVPLPDLPVPSTLAEALTVRSAWRQAFNEVKAEATWRASERPYEEARLESFLQELALIGVREPERAEEFAADGFALFRAREILLRRDLEQAALRVKDLVFQAKREVAERIYRRNREIAEDREELERRREIEERARQESTSRQLEPLIGFLRFMAREWEEELPPLTMPRKRPVRRLPNGCWQRDPPPSRPTPFFWPYLPRCRRYEERLEHLARRPFPHHQGLPKLAIAARKRKGCHSDSQHYMKRLARGWAQEIDPRSEWRREYRELTGR